MTAARIERSFVGAILSMITVILILFTFNNNEWLTVLSAHPQISPPWWWDNQKMRARKTLQTTGWRRSLLAAALASKIKTNVNRVHSVHLMNRLNTKQPPTRWPRQMTWTVSPHVGCHHLHPPMPFIIITQLKGLHSFYHPTKDRRMSQAMWIATYQNCSPSHEWSPIQN